MHGQNVKFPIAFAQPRTQARERKLRTFEEHWKRQIQDPRNIEHFFQVWIMEGNSGSGVVYMGPGP